MLNILSFIPHGLLELEACRLHERLPGPTLIHLPGRRPERLFVSVLLHGNEASGWLALRALLRDYVDKELPRALSLFIGNIAAARARQRFLPGQPDYNRIWEGGPAVEGRAEHWLVRQVLEEMGARPVFAAIDIHNTTGLNPRYASVRRLDSRSLQLAVLFGRTVVYFRKPEGVLVGAFADLCPAVTLECGQSGEPAGVTHAREFVEACLQLAHLPEQAVAPQDIDLFHTVAIARVPPALRFGLQGDDLDLRLAPDLDHLNFRELPPGTTIGWLRAGLHAGLEVRDELGREVDRHFFALVDGEIRTRVPVIPALLTRSVEAIRQDCLCYLMEPFYVGREGAASSAHAADRS